MLLEMSFSSRSMFPVHQLFAIHKILQVSLVKIRMQLSKKSVINKVNLKWAKVDIGALVKEICC